MSRREKQLSAEFRDFALSAGEAAPESAAHALFAKVRADLHPSAWAVFAKLLGVHGVVGTLSLAVCNQFEMNPFGTSFSLSDYFMRFGHSTCMVLCGVLFAGSTVAVAGWLLRPEELRVLGRNVFLQLLALCALSLGAFAAFGAEIALTIGLLWAAGSLAGGALASKVFWPRLPRLAAN